MGKTHLLEEIYKIVAINNENLRKLWFSHIVFTWRWWLGVALTIIPWIVWIKIRNKNNEIQLLFTGLVIAMATNVLDLIGICWGLWYYDYKVTPMIVSYIPWDYSLFPVSVMLLLQFKPKVNVFIKAIIFSLVCAFVFEPFFAYIDIYVYVNWRHWYSFIIYIILYLIFNKIYNSDFLNRYNTT